MLASPLLIDIGRSQFALVAQGMGVTFGALYLADDRRLDGRSPQLVPVLVYPESSQAWAQARDDADRAGARRREAESRLLPPGLPAARGATGEDPPGAELRAPGSDGVAGSGATGNGATGDGRTRTDRDSGDRDRAPDREIPTSPGPTAPAIASEPLPAGAGALGEFGELDDFPERPDGTRPPADPSRDRVMLPLVYEGMALGLLVVRRPGLPWTASERDRLDRVARSLAAACALDRRYRWLEDELDRQRALHRQQQDLMHDLLHQFRNPLTAVRTFGKLLLRRLTGDRDREAAEGIVRETDRLQEMLVQFRQVVDWGDADLASSALEAGEPAAPASASPATLPGQRAEPLLLPGGGTEGDWAATLEPVDLAEVLRPLLVAAAAVADDRGLCLVADIPESLPPVRGDAAVLREALSNPIDNALKYTAAPGTVRVRVGVGYPSARARAAGAFPDRPEAPRRYAVLAVRDDGCGIPPADLARVFDRHYRGVQATSPIPGTGLGLAIVRNAIAAMQGVVQAFSPALSLEALLDATAGDASSAEPDADGPDAAGTDLAGNDLAGNNSTGTDTAGTDTAGTDSIGANAAGTEATAPGAIAAPQPERPGTTLAIWLPVLANGSTSPSDPARAIATDGPPQPADREARRV